MNTPAKMQNTAAPPPTHDTCANPPQERAHAPTRATLRLPADATPRPSAAPPHRTLRPTAQLKPNPNQRPKPRASDRRPDGCRKG